jgi:uncharacterized protein with beta-barrel porin domain
MTDISLITSKSKKIKTILKPKISDILSTCAKNQTCIHSNQYNHNTHRFFSTQNTQNCKIVADKNLKDQFQTVKISTRTRSILRALSAIIFAVTLLLTFALSQNNETFAQVLHPGYPIQATTTITTNINVNNIATPYSITINFYGLPDPNGGYIDSFSNHPDWVDAITAGFEYWASICNAETGLGDNGQRYEIWLGNPPEDQASTNGRIADDPNTGFPTYTITFDADRRTVFNVATENGAPANSGNTGQVRDHNVTVNYNWRNQTIHELSHILGWDAGINAAGTGFDLDPSRYRIYLDNKNTNALPGMTFNAWGGYDDVDFIGSLAMDIFNDHPLDGGSGLLRNILGDGNSDTNEIPLGGTGISPEAVLNHLKYQNIDTNMFMLMGWDVKTELARNFLSELELAIMVDSGLMDLNFGLQQHFGMSIYQQRGGIAGNGHYDPYKLVYDWSAHEHQVIGNYLGPNTGYESYVSNFATGLHIVSGNNKLSYDGILMAGRMNDVTEDSFDNLYGRYTAGIRVENHGNWLSIKDNSDLAGQYGRKTLDVSEVSGQFGLLVASGSYEDRNATFTLINRGTISSSLRALSGTGYYVYRFEPDKPLSDTIAYPMILVDYGKGPELVLDKNEIRTGIYLDAWASELNFIGTGKLYNGIFVDEGVGIWDGMNFVGEGDVAPEAHGNFINWNANKDGYVTNAITPVITFGRQVKDELLDASYTIQYVDAKNKDEKLIAAVFNGDTHLYEVIGTGYYNSQNNSQIFVLDPEAEAKYQELIQKDPNKYGLPQTIKISSGIENITTVSGKFFGEFYGGPWQVETWGGLTEFYIPNRDVYNGDTTSSVATGGYQINYNNVRFVIGADDVGASQYLPYDPSDRRQGASSELHLNYYNSTDDPYDNYFLNANGTEWADATYVFHQEVVFGSKNNTGSILSGENGTYNSSAIFEKGIDNWITIQEFHRIEAKGTPEHLYRLWINKDDSSKIDGVDFSNHNNIMQGLFRNPDYVLPYLKDKDHYEEWASIVICHDELADEILLDTVPNGTDPFDKLLGEISLFNRYSGVIKDVYSPDAEDGIYAQFGIWIDRDYSDFYGQMLSNRVISAGTFIENYGIIDGIGGSTYINSYVLAGSYIYNAFDAKMDNNYIVRSGATSPNTPLTGVFTYIANGGQMTYNDYIIAGTDLINLKTGVIENTYSRITAVRDLYNFGLISNTAASQYVGTLYDGRFGEDLEYTDHFTHNPVDGGIYTKNGNIYNLDNGNLNDEIIGRMLGNRHIVARADSGANTPREHYIKRTYFGTSGSLINEGKIGYTFGIEKRYDIEMGSSEVLLASIETTNDLINLNEGIIYDTTMIKVQRDLYNEVLAQIKNTAYLDVTENAYNRDAGEITNTSFFTVGRNLYNEGWGVIDTGTNLSVKWDLYNGDDIVESKDKTYPLSHLATIKNFATIQVNNGKLINGQYGLLTDNNTIIAPNVQNEGIIEHFFTFDIQQSLTNKSGGIISVAQDATLTTRYTISNEKGANLFIFGDVKANQIVNEGTILGTGSIIMNNVSSVFHNTGHVAPGGGTVLLPYSDEGNQYFKNYGTSSIGNLNLYGKFINDENGTFDITINPYPDDNPISKNFDPTTMKTLNSTKSVTQYGRIDGDMGMIDSVSIRTIRDKNGNVAVLNSGEAEINGGTLNIWAKDNVPGTINPARYFVSQLPFLVTEGGLKVTQTGALKAYLPNGGTGIVLFDFVPDYDDYTYWINVQRKYDYGNVAGQTINQKAIGQYLNNIGSNPDPTSDFFLALVLLDLLSDPENVGVQAGSRKVSRSALFALDQMSGAIYGTMETASFQNTTTILSQLADYLRNDPLLTYCKDCRVYEPSKLDLWGIAYGTLGGSDHDGNAYGYDQSTGGTIIGFDRLYQNYLRLGVFGSFGSSTYKTDLLEKSKATDISSGFYARKDLKRGYLLGTIGFGYTDYHTTRQISFANQRAKSDRDAYLWSAYLERALNLDSRIGRIQPYIGAQYIGNQHNNFDETGAGTLSLQGRSSNAHSLRSILGARFTQHPRMFRGGKLETFLNFDWKLELLRYNKGNLTAHFTNPNFANFAGTGSFHVYGNKQNRSWLDAGIGTNWDRNNTRFSLGYNININGNGFFLHTGNIALTYAR